MIPAPIEPGGLADYAVKAEIQFIPARYECSEHAFGIVVRNEGRTGGYTAQVSNLCTLSGANIAVYGGSLEAAVQLEGDVFVPEQEWHTYRLEVVGNQLTFLIDGAVIAEAVDYRYLSGGRAGLFTFGVQLNGHKFKVVAL